MLDACLTVLVGVFKICLKMEILNALYYLIKDATLTAQRKKKDLG